MSTALAAALALAAGGLPTFPCHADKRPASPHGFLDATADPDAIRALWRRYPGPLVGVPTGALDLDRKHSEAAAWWHANRGRLPETRMHRTRGGGLHVLFVAQPDLRCSAGKLTLGIDVRAVGGYIIDWSATGLPVRDAPLAPWPGFLLDQLRPPPPAARPTITLPRGAEAGRRYALAALRNAVGRVASAPIGTRNAELNRETFGLARLVGLGALTPATVAGAMAHAGLAAGLTQFEVERTIASALRARGGVE
jgi:hypothetical protein